MRISIILMKNKKNFTYNQKEEIKYYLKKIENYMLMKKRLTFIINIISLKSIDLSSLNIKSANNMSYLFFNCNSLDSINFLHLI